MTADLRPRPTRVRYLVLAALASGAILSYLLRVSLAPAGTTVQRDLGLSDLAMGDVFSAFFLGYFWFQVPGGWAGNRLGTRLALGAMGLLWAGATLLSASARSEGVLYASRVLLGVAQAGLFPVTIMAIRDWFPLDRRGFASATMTTCMSVGAVLAGAATTRLLDLFGWRGTFLLYALLASAWALAFLAWFRDTPDRHPRVNPAELDLIRARAGAIDAPVAPVQDVGTGEAVRAMAVCPGMWALCTQSFFQAFGYAVFITWFPAYLEKGRGLSVTRAGDLTLLPLVTVAAGSLFGGYLIDLILKRTGSKWLSRFALPSAGLALCAAAVAVASLLKSPTAAVALIALGMLFSGVAMPGKWACTIDLTGGYSAVGFAIMNMTGNVGAWVCPKVVGRLFQGLEAGGAGWDSFLYLIAGVQLLAAASCFVLNPNRPAVGGGS